LLGDPRRGVRGGAAVRGTEASGMSGELLVAGPTSDAGKSVDTAGICRWPARRGVRVAPLKRVRRGS
jgi:Cobyric acid synthase